VIDDRMSASPVVNHSFEKKLDLGFIGNYHIRLYIN
jgi:hypothetical protein